MYERCLQGRERELGHDQNLLDLSAALAGNRNCEMTTEMYGRCNKGRARVSSRTIILP